MRSACALATIGIISVTLLPVRADTIYPTLRCRVFADTAYTQIAEQCGTIVRSYHLRRLFLRATTRPRHCCDLY
jgi:hypothetical protein